MRAQGEEVADSRTITIDSTPPITTVRSTLPLTSSAFTPTPTDNLTFSFDASDASAVVFQCQLFAAMGAGFSAPPFFRRVDFVLIPYCDAGRDRLLLVQMY